ncbi:MAG: Rieske (2Fe-2S) protein [Nitrospiria bacterium]
MPFIPVAKIDEIPLGCGKLVEINHLEIALFRLGDTVYATSNVCPHQGASLADGKLKGDEVVCPWHQWCFNIKEGTSPLSPKLKIRTYPVKLEGQQISIFLATTTSLV